MPTNPSCNTTTNNANKTADCKGEDEEPNEGRILYPVVPDGANLREMEKDKPRAKPEDQPDIQARPAPRRCQRVEQSNANNACQKNSCGHDYVLVGADSGIKPRREVASARTNF